MSLDAAEPAQPTRQRKSVEEILAEAKALRKSTSKVTASLRRSVSEAQAGLERVENRREYVESLKEADRLRDERVQVFAHGEMQRSRAETQANPHLLESTDYHIYCMVAHQDPLKMPGGPDSQARIIEEASGCHRRQRCPEIQQACMVPYEPTECSYDSRRSSQRGTPYPRSVQSAPSGGYPAYPVASPSRSSVRGSRAGSARGSARGGGSYTGSRRGSASVDATPRSARRQEDGRRRAMSSRRSDASGYSARSRGSSYYYDSQYSGSRYSGSRYEGSRYSGSIR